MREITGIILAAGLSSRMGKPKSLLPYKGKPFLINIIDRLDHVCSKIIIVTGHEGADIQERTISYLEDNKRYQLLSKISFGFNPQYRKGMFTSLKKALYIAPVSSWYLYHFCDQQGLPEDFYCDFISQLENGYDWIQPIINNQKGHPILFNSKMAEIIRHSSPDSDLRQLSASEGIKKKLWECGYSHIFSDIDTPDDYRKLLNEIE